MNTIKFIAMHHAGGLGTDRYASTQDLTAQHINNAHRARWDFLSSLGHYGGYSFFIDKNGYITQFRAIGEETAAQIGHNFDTVSICIAGNFVKKNGVPIDIPTEAQKRTTCKLLSALTGGKIDLSLPPLQAIPGAIIQLDPSSIHHHSFYQISTECDCLPDAYWRDLLKESDVPPPATKESPPQAVLGLVDAIIALLTQLKEHLKVVFSQKKVGSVDRAHCGDL